MNKIAITCGDPAGIGPEIIYDWWNKGGPGRETVIIIGPEKWLSQFKGGESWQFVAVGKDTFDYKAHVMYPDVVVSPDVAKSLIRQAKVKPKKIATVETQ